MTPTAPLSEPSSPRAAVPGLFVFLARRGLFRSRLGAALLFCAVAAAVGFQIPATATVVGYRLELIAEGVEAGFGDVRLRPRKGQRFDDALELTAKLEQERGVRAARPLLVLPGAVGREGELTAAPVLGVAAGEMQPFRLIEGQPLPPGDDQGLLLGSALAARLGIEVGELVDLRVVFASGPMLLPEEETRRYRMTVRGLCTGAFGAFESIFVDRDFLAERLGAPKAASMVLVHAHDHDAADALAARLAARFPEADARSWMVDSAYLQSAVAAAAAVSVATQSMVVIAVAIPVLALLYIDVMSRRREVGLLGALGFHRAEIFVIFLLQALVVGLVGVGLGCGLGYGLIRYFQAYPIFEWEGFVIRPALDLGCFVKPAAAVLGATLLAGVYPALRAARMDPAGVLRGIE